MDDIATHKAFIDAIAEDPDDTARLVYADWLDDRGDPRAEYVRLEVEAGTVIDLWEEAVASRLHQLRTSLDAEWLRWMSYAIVLIGYDPHEMISVYKIVRQEASLGFADAKRLLHSIPQTIWKNLVRHEAIRLLNRLQLEHPHVVSFEARFNGWRR